jgi:hypothetical protein
MCVPSSITPSSSKPQPTLSLILIDSVKPISLFLLSLLVTSPTLHPQHNSPPYLAPTRLSPHPHSRCPDASHIALLTSLCFPSCS